MKTKFRMATLAAAAFLSLVSVSASAGLTLLNGSNTPSDSSAEFAFRIGLGGVATPVTGALAKDDYFFSVVNFDAAWTPAGAGVSGTTEFTALSLIKINTITPDAGPTSSCGGAVAFGLCSTFGMVAPTLAVWGGVFSTFGVPLALLANMNASTVAIFFRDDSKDFIRTSTIPAGVASASDGTLALVADLSGTGAYWNAAAPSSVATITALASGTKVGTFDFKGEVSYQDLPGYLIGPNIIGDGTVRSAGVPPFGGFPIFDQSSVTIDVKVLPEPGTLGLMGLGIFAIGALQRKKRSAKNME